MKTFKSVLLTAILALASACGTNQAPLMNYGLGFNGVNTGTNGFNNSGQSTTNISGGTRTTTWILYGQTYAGADKTFQISHQVQAMDQVKWFVQGAGVMAQGMFGGSTLPLSQFNVKVNNAPIGNGMTGAPTVSQAGTLTISFDAWGTNMFGNNATYLVSFPYGAGVVINRCVNTSGQPMQCP
jgi:hypothetical protein